MTRWIQPTCTVLILGGVVVCAWQAQAVRRAGDGLRDTADLLVRTVRARSYGFAMNYSSVTFTSGSNTTTYTDVTGYTAHENYVAFTGKGPGDETAKSYEINRTAFDSVVKTT